jgi:hypothetical protein
MDPTAQTPTSPPASQAAPAEQPAASAPPQPAAAFTADQVAQMVADAKRQAHDAAMAEARRVFEGKQKPASTPAPQPTPPTGAQPSGLTFADLARFQAFNAAAAEIGIPPAGAEMLLTRWAEARPTDTRAWLAAEAAPFGWSKPASPSTPSAGTPATPASPSAPAVPATPTPSGSPPAPSAGVYDPKPSQMKPADVQAFIAKNGPKAWMALVRQELAGTRVTPPPRR